MPTAGRHALRPSPALHPRAHKRLPLTHPRRSRNRLPEQRDEREQRLKSKLRNAHLVRKGLAQGKDGPGEVGKGREES